MGQTRRGARYLPAAQGIAPGWRDGDPVVREGLRLGGLGLGESELGVGESG